MKIGIQTWGSQGDVRPFIALAAGLSSAGHEVTLAITEITNQDFTEFGERLNFSVRHVGHFDMGENHFKGLALKQLHRRNVTPEKLARAIKKVLSSPELSRNAKAIAAAMEKENGVKAAVELIEKTMALYL